MSQFLVVRSFSQSRLSYEAERVTQRVFTGYLWFLFQSQREVWKVILVLITYFAERPGVLRKIAIRWSWKLDGIDKNLPFCCHNKQRTFYTCLEYRLIGSSTINNISVFKTKTVLLLIVKEKLNLNKKTF